MLLPCVLVIKTTHWAAASAAEIHISLLTPIPMSIKAVQSFQPGAFSVHRIFSRVLGGGGWRGGGVFNKEEGEKKKRELKKNDLLSICAVVILKMLNWVNVYT